MATALPKPDISKLIFNSFWSELSFEDVRVGNSELAKKFEAHKIRKQVKLVQNNQSKQFIIENNSKTWLHYIKNRRNLMSLEVSFVGGNSDKVLTSMKSYFFIEKYLIDRPKNPPKLLSVKRNQLRSPESSENRLVSFNLIIDHKHPVEKFSIDAVSNVFDSSNHVLSGPFYKNKSSVKIELPDNGYTFKIKSTDFLQGKNNPVNSVSKLWFSECGLEENSDSKVNFVQNPINFDRVRVFELNSRKLTIWHRNQLNGPNSTTEGFDRETATQFCQNNNLGRVAKLTREEEDKVTRLQRECCVGGFLSLVEHFNLM